MGLARAAVTAVDLDAELVALYPGLARRLTLVLGNASDGEDVAQAAVARALEQRHRFAGGDVRAWVYTIGLRLAFNELRHRKRTARWPVGDEPTWALTTDIDLWRALGELEPLQRAALLMSVLDGYTHEEIGRMLGVRTGTVSSWLSRTKERLRAVLGDDRR